jgi:hypothetical protein
MLLIRLNFLAFRRIGRHVSPRRISTRLCGARSPLFDFTRRRWRGSESGTPALKSRCPPHRSKSRGISPVRDHARDKIRGQALRIGMPCQAGATS